MSDQNNHQGGRGRGRGRGNRGNKRGSSDGSRNRRERNANQNGPNNNYDRRQRENGDWFNNRGNNDNEGSTSGGHNRNRNDSSQGRNSGNYRKKKYEPRQMGYKLLQSILEKNDVEEITIHLNNSLAGFKLLLSTEEIKNDVVVLVVQLLKIVCGCSFQNTSISILQAALTSNFMKNLTYYVTGILSQSARDKTFNKHFWDDPDDFWNNIITISRFIYDTIPTYCEEMRKLLETVQLLIPGIETRHSMHISDEIKANVESLISAMDLAMKELEKKKEKRVVADDEDEGEPPDDYRDIPIIPSAVEVTTNCHQFIRKNVVKGQYLDVHHYLDVQFRLLRSDFVIPLREGICSYIADPKKKLDDIRIYKPITFVGTESFNDQDCYKIQFDFSNKKKNYRSYENTKRFMFGSLVLFTPDKFKTLLFAKIVNRDPKLLEQGQLVVGFHEPVEINSNAEYLMVESKVYFEPYYQVLRVLQHMSHEDFPMERYIIKAEKDCRPPQYLITIDPVFYTIEGTRFWPLNWPQKTFYGLNNAQTDAFKAALTKEFLIIQGPPGTGKTFLGLKIAHTLLENHKAWYKRSPILVICYTNHALDQFLEGLLPVTQKMVRVGGQSKNEALAKFNIARKRHFKNNAVYAHRNEVKRYLGCLQDIGKSIEEIDGNWCIMDFQNFKKSSPEFRGSWFDGANKDKIAEWLLGGRSTHVNRYTGRPALQNTALEEGEDDLEDDGIETPDDNHERVIELDDLLEELEEDTADRHSWTFDLHEMRNKIKNLNRRLDVLSKQEKTDMDRALEEEVIYTELCSLEDQLAYLENMLGAGRVSGQPEYVNLTNPRTMTAEDRWRLYFLWLKGYRRSLLAEQERVVEKYKEAYKLYSDMREMEDVQMMREQLVVGMTTTGAARLQESLQALRSPIVIVEEAAEVLEAHIIAALTRHCQHLILIGDHQQLKPSTANFKIETRYKLGISLFERMVLNEIECHTLNVQHRMRPEISRLIRPAIYPVLADHETTLGRDSIRGIENTVFFVEHEEREQLCGDSSKKNLHEARFVIALARHLILNGYEPGDITILSAYLGQMFEMQRERALPHNRLLLQDVRIAVLDNYQGEESKIIILSLVRSNDEQRVGFLHLENRVCVALSRARDGFYAIGNMQMLCEKTEIWPKVRQVLETQGSVGPRLSLRCQVHPFKVTEVCSADDFAQISEGGCDQKCDAELVCGHRCHQLCHVRDREHVKYRCMENCGRVLCDDETHVCQKRCYEECGPCTYPVLRWLNCGHKVSIECHIDPEQYNCRVLVQDVRLPCGHVTDKPCSDDPNTFRCPHPCDTRVEPCGHQCKKNCHIRNDPDHLQYKCQERCIKPRNGCKDPENIDHRCPNFCHQNCVDCVMPVKKVRTVCPHQYTIACMLDVDDITCEKPCKKMLPCGHKCRKKCCEPCGQCDAPVEKAVPGCGHTVKVKCHEEPSRYLCNGNCPRSLPCGHQCKNKCREDCTSLCDEIVNCDIPSPCGHRVKQIKCHHRNTGDVNVLVKECMEPCGAALLCKHTCLGTCGACSQGRAHIPCSEKCGVPQVCGHECQFPCREACRPCNRPCGFRCRHSRCKRKCGEPCTHCKQPCGRRCVHQECKKFCGLPCSVPPCTEPCPKRLRCDHPCLGFCGDPCPAMCSTCEPDEFEMLLMTYATEEEEEARLVVLADCGHVVVSEGMEKWLQGDGDVIKAKECPQCRTPIMTTERYSDYVKQALQFVFKVKRKFNGDEKTNNNKCVQLSEQASNIRQKFSLKSDFTFIVKAIDILLDRLKPTKANRRQAINSIEINSIEQKIQVLERLVGVFEKEKAMHQSVPCKNAIAQLKFMVKILTRSVDRTTDQEIADLNDEMRRLQRFIQLDKIKASLSYREAHTRADVAESTKRANDVIGCHRKFTEGTDAEARRLLEDLNRKVGAAVALTEAERLQIVAAIGVQRGAWFKCPNGHPYAIGECGGAMQVGRCAECKAPIGGGDHRLLDGQRFAPEMDGASAPAWPGVHY